VYPVNDAYYFGIRIKLIEGMPTHIQMTETLRIFYNKMKDWVFPDEKLAKMVQDMDVDIKVNYFDRANLPDEVRPKNTNK